MDVPKSTILVIDDEANLVLGLKAILERDGYPVITARDGNDGLRQTIEHKPDLIICDVMMPPPNGFELRSLLNRHPDTSSIPFIFLTARADRSDRLQGLDEGADDYITKPFDRQELIARIKAVLRRNDLGRKQGLQELDDELEKLRTEISHNISHELRTPLTVLLWTLELSLHEKFHDKPEEQAKFVGQALQSAHQLQSLIEDMMTLNDIDRNELNVLRTSTNVERAFMQAVEEVTSRWKSKGLQIKKRYDPKLTISVPVNPIKRVVSHLVDNACKFSEAGGNISISVEPNGPGGFMLSVVDDGPGIPPELRERVFERFYQISQGIKRQFGGLGVGLTVSRAIARRLGGDVVIQDSQIGCHITLIVPPSNQDT